MSNNLSNQTVVLTGEASGIGKGIAEAFLQEGAKLLLVDVNETKLLDTAFELKEKYGEDQNLLVDGGFPEGRVFQSKKKMVTQ